MLRLQTFGGCFIERDGVRLDTASAHRKGLALLAVLAAAGERGISRDSVIALLWPESGEERARTSLRQLVHLLRNQLNSPDLIVSAPELRLNEHAISSDVSAFSTALAADDLETAAALYRGPWLDGFYLKGTDELERWIEAERASLANAAARALEVLAQRAEARGDMSAATAWWRTLTGLEPLSTRAALGLMRTLDNIGERAAALQHARVHELLVQNELGAASDTSVAAFAHSLRTTPAPPPARVEPAARASDGAPGPQQRADEASRPRAVEAPRSIGAGRSLRRSPIVVSVIVALLLATGFVIATWTRSGTVPSLVVLPLSNTSGDADNDVISDGLTENLIAALATVPDVRVIGRTSAFQFKQRTLDLRAIADSLDVSAVLDGSVQRAGEELKISVQLVSADDGSVLWAETYDRRLSDFFAIQDEITRAIVGALRPRLAMAGGSQRGSRTIRDVEAYELYLRGRQIFMTQTDRESTDRARLYFERSLARDSLLAQSHAGLSDVYTRLAIFAHMPAREGFARAREHALRALALDSTLAEAHIALGHALCVADFEWDAADRAFERALALNPSYTFGRMPYAICLMSRGRFRDAERQLLTARELDPLSPAPSNMLGRLYVQTRQPDRAIEHLRLALELSPQMDLALQQLGHAYLQKGMAAEAIDAFQRAAVLSGARDSAHLAYAYAVTGRADEARRILDGLAATPERGLELAFHLALGYAGLGDHDRAFEWLEHGLDEPASFMVGTAIEPAFRAMHDDPRWPPLMRRMRLDR